MGHVYILSANRYWDGKNLVKIGMTDRPNVYDRFNEIASQWMDDRGISINLYHSAKVTNPTAVETALHREFKRPVRLYNKDIWAEFGSECGGDSEWFAMDDRQLQQAVRSLNSYRSTPWLDTDRTPWAGIIGTAIGLLSIGWMLFSVLNGKPKSSDNKITVVKLANIRSTPNGAVLCRVQAGDQLDWNLKPTQTIADVRSKSWIPVKACGRSGVIFKSLTNID